MRSVPINPTYNCFDLNDISILFQREDHLTSLEKGNKLVDMSGDSYFYYGGIEG